MRLGVALLCLVGTAGSISFAQTSACPNTFRGAQIEQLDACIAELKEEIARLQRSNLQEIGTAYPDQGLSITIDAGFCLTYWAKNSEPAHQIFLRRDNAEESLLVPNGSIRGPQEVSFHVVGGSATVWYNIYPMVADNC